MLIDWCVKPTSSQFRLWVHFCFLKHITTETADKCTLFDVRSKLEIITHYIKVV